MITHLSHISDYPYSCILLQAAALCLDKFLVIKLLAHIVGDDNLRLEAKKQLEEIRSRIVKERKEQQEYVSSAAGDKKEVHEKAQDSSKGDRKEAHEKAQDSAKGDRKEAQEKTQDASADLSEYGAPIKALLKAYTDYLTQHPSLSSQNKWDKLEKLWDVVGSCHKRLPRYILQEIFKNKRWTADPVFSREPRRGELRYCNGVLLDLDVLGDGNLFALYKSYEATWWGSGGMPVDSIAMDSAALTRLYERRLVDLGNIIDALATPKAALALIASDKGMGLMFPKHPQ